MTFIPAATEAKLYGSADILTIALNTTSLE